MPLNDMPGQPDRVHDQVHAPAGRQCGDLWGIMHSRVLRTDHLCKMARVLSPLKSIPPEQLFIHKGATDILAIVSRTLESQWLEIATSALQETDRMDGWMSCDCKRSVTS